MNNLFLKIRNTILGKLKLKEVFDEKDKKSESSTTESKDMILTEEERYKIIKEIIDEYYYIGLITLKELNNYSNNSDQYIKKLEKLLDKSFLEYNDNTIYCWLAVDGLGNYWIFDKCPNRYEYNNFWVNHDGTLSKFIGKEFKNIDLTWEDEPIKIPISLTEDLKTEEIVKQFTTGIKNKELQEILKQWPKDAEVIVECCNIKNIKYNKTDNTIRID